MNNPSIPSLMFRLFYIFFFIFLFSIDVYAINTARTDQAEIRLLSATSDAGKDQKQLLFGLEFTLEPDWKIYWRAAGAGGKPPLLHWQENSQNITDLEIEWPFPTAFKTYGLHSNGYEDHVILPLLVRRENLDDPVLLDLVVDFFICSEICIPDQVHVSQSLPVGSAVQSSDAALIAQWRLTVPKIGSDILVSAPEGVQGDGSSSRLAWQIQSAQPISQIQAFVDAEGEAAPAVITFNEARTEAILSIDTQRMAFDQSGALVLATKIQDEILYSRHPFSQITQEGVSWGWVLLLALAGGLIINIMPCVLPVLMVKIFGALSNRPEQSRRGFLMMGLGVVSSFAALGAVFAILRAGGTALHWGVQFQQPLFLICMIFVLLAFAAQLLGWWNITLPQIKGMQSDGIAAEFSAGVVAAILATPCSAPLVGASIGLALFLPPSAMMLIIVTMGMGMALPYFLLASFPPILRLMPNPGPWIYVLKKLMAVSIFGTAIWVAWLLVAQMGYGGAATVFFVGILAVFALAMVHFPETKIAPHRIKLVLLLFGLALLLPARFPAPDNFVTLSKNWQEFTPSQVTGLVQEGKTVLVDVTADWCISCVVNDKLVFDQQVVQDWRGKDDVVAMRGDWSAPNAEIKEYLAGFQRQALPFAILFTPHAPEGVILPELITMASFQQILQKVKASALTKTE